MPGASREAVFIDFHGFSWISAGFEAIWGQKVGQPVAGCGGLRPVAGCGPEVLPLEDDAIRQGALCNIDAFPSDFPVFPMISAGF